MKKNILLLILVITTCITAHATINTVHVSNNKFVPGTFNAIVGDTVRWVWDEGVHTTTTSASNIPAGADAWDAPMDASNTSFMYVIKVAGDYFYFSKVDGDMSGTFTATGTLPVQLTNFAITNTANNKPLISWNTLTEQNTSYFSLQRSTDAIKFLEIAKINAAGNSSSLKSYSYTDNNTGTENNYLYYMIETVDKDGRKQFSDIRNFKNNAAAIKLITALHPNPASNPVTINFQCNANKAGNMLLQLYDAGGNIIRQKAIDVSAGLNNTFFQAGNLAAGMYIIKFELEGIKETRTILVQ